MSTDEYVPSEGQIRAACYDVFRPAEFDRFLARVRRDAEAELGSWMARAYEAEGKLWKAEARIKAVRELHAPRVEVVHGGAGSARTFTVCAECRRVTDAPEGTLYPCPTIQALDGSVTPTGA